MARIKYYYDTETCRYERIRTTTSDIILNAMGIMIICMAFGVLFSFMYIKYFPSNRELALKKENDELLYSYDLLNKDLRDAKDMLVSLQDRDDNIYRVIFEAEPIPLEIRQAGSGGSQRYQDLLDKKLIREELIMGTHQKIDNLKKQMYIQTKSYDEIVALAKRKADMLGSIPAIQPISNKELKRFASGYGLRVDPILKVKKMHWGCDFSAPTGTPIYSTGDGVIKKVSKSRKGYGNQIEVDHGYGYVTKYAHLSKFEIKKGQKVKRGQLIGRVGNTGRSVGPHLHYEIIHNGRKVNPVNYFHNDLSPEQYEKLLELAEIENQSFGS